jgi:hypothetical protein
MSKLFISYVRHNDIPVSDITYLKKLAIKSQKSLIYVLKIGKFSALDFYDVSIRFFCSRLYLV